MATEMFVKPTITNGHDEDDDEAPVVFKRSSTSDSNHNHSNAHVQRSRVAMTSRAALPSRSPIARPNPSSSSMKASEPSTSSAKASLVKSPLGTSSSKAFNDKTRSLNNSLGFDSDDEDSEDHVPLNVRIVGNSNEVNKGKIYSSQVKSQRPVQRTSDNLYRPIKREDGDGRFHSSSKLQGTTSVGTSGSKYDSLDEKKPMARKFHQNGSVEQNKELNSQASSRMPMDRPELAMLAKRLKDKGNSSNQSSAERPKLPESSTLMKTKQFPVKPEKSDNGQKVLSSTTTMKVNQVSVKHVMSDDDTDHIPLSKRIKLESSDTKSSSFKKRDAKVVSSSKTFAKKPMNSMKDSKYSKSSKSSTSGDGQKKWTTLVHNGVIFPPPYKPHGINIRYKGIPVNLNPEQEEVATMFAVMKETLYYDKPKFRENFWNDWRKLLGKNHQIQSLDDCDFSPIYDWHLMEKEKKKQMSSEEKKAKKEEKLKQEEKYMWAIVDGVKEKVGNFRVEPPGLFRGRGEHPKMGKLKRRIHPSEITINIGKDAPIPECPIIGERWREVKHDNTVTWLAFWNDPINPKDTKYVFLAASSALKGQSDKEKYEKARKLKEHIGNIRAAYTKDFTSKDVTKQQIAVATYLIDKLALRAGNEKDDDEADTVGCCTLKVGNVECIPPNKLKFDFLGKDSIQYVNTVEVEPPVYKAIGELQSGKSKTDNLFDELDTSILNAHLKELMPGLTAKVFRTYNASITLDEMLNKETKDGDVAEKLVVYQQANKQVAIICNHQRSVSKSHGSQIEKLSGKINELKGVLEELQTDLDRAKKGKPPLMDSDGKRKRNLTPLDLEKSIAQTNAKIEKMERDMQTKEDMKTVALGTSKLNYMDPRVTVAWCKRHEVPIEKLFNKSLLEKFTWALDVDPEFRF